jgi:LysM repeat protein
MYLGRYFVERVIADGMFWMHNPASRHALLRLPVGKGHPMSKIISGLLVAFSSAAIAASAWAQAAKPLELAPDAPDRYTVTAGDTLWGISAKFIKDPYRWPELWRMNATDVKNPHLIYPGQVLVLDKSGSDPQLRVDSVRLAPKQYDTKLSDAIPAIPQSFLEPFLAKPLVIEPDGLDKAPRVVAVEEGHMIVGTGNKIYVTGIGDSSAKGYLLYRPGRTLTDPVSGEVLGIEAIHLGGAKVATPGEPAILDIVNSRAEISVGDRLMASTAANFASYVPHAPKSQIEGRVMSIYGTTGSSPAGTGGPGSIVTITRGARDGLEMGHVLAINQPNREVTERFNDRLATHQLPEERYGLVFVFRVFDRMSYAIVTKASSKPVVVGDTVRTP